MRLAAQMSLFGSSQKPMAGVCDNATIEAVLRRREGLRQVRAYCSLVLGAPLTLISPFVLGSIFWVVSGLLFESWYHWGWFFLALAVITIPLLFRLELKSGGDYLSDTMKDVGPPLPGAGEMTMKAHVAIGPFAGLAVSMVTSPRVSSAGLVEIFLMGPRMIVSGIRRLRQVRAFPPIDSRLASRIIARLLSHDSGLRLEELPKDGVGSDQLLSVLRWLAYYDWIGISEAKDRVFLYSESRAKFGQA